MPQKQGIFPLIPFAVPKPWAGGHLDNLANNRLDDKIGEYVLFSDLDQFPVRVRVGAENIPLSRFWRSLNLKEQEVPFMLKILSTAEPISLQNHPSDNDVTKLGLSGKGKFECWSILEADQNACAYLGLKPGEQASILRSLETDRDPLSHFNVRTPKAGDVITLNPGLVHSTTGRILFYEIQQKSDHTFRIFDFGRGRTLHLDQAISCIHDQEPKISSFASKLNTEEFSVAYHDMSSLKSEKLHFAKQGREFSVFSWFGEKIRLSNQGQTYDMLWGDSVLIITDEQFQIEHVPPSHEEKQRLQDLPCIDMLFEAYR